MQSAALVLALVVFGSVATTWRTMRVGPFPGRSDYLLFMASGVWWATCALCEVSTLEPELRLFYSELAWYGIITTPLFWVLFVSAYVRGTDLPRTALRTGLAISMGVVVLAIAISNDIHHLLYLSVTPDPSPAYPGRLRYEHAPLFYALMLIIYAFMMMVTARILWATIYASAVHRLQFAGLLLSALVPWAANAAYNIGGLRVLGFDPTPLAFSLMPLIYNFLISRNQFLVLAPVALNAVLSAHPDGMLVLSPKGLIVEANAAAKVIFEEPHLVGKSFSDLRTNVTSSERRDLFADALPTVHWRKGGRVYEVRTVDVDPGGHAACVAIVVRDISEYLRAQENLRISTRLMEERLEANMRLQEQLRDMALRDSLTGLNNRRVLDDVGNRLIANADAGCGSLVAVSLDLDHFKRLNDTYGHKVGDDALVAVAAILSRSLRPGEVAVRMGGEEFLVLMPDMEIEDARARAEAWRAIVRAMPIETSQGPAEVTFSAGISAFPDMATSFEQLLQQADKAVYAAKRAGRNRIVIARRSLGEGDGEAIPA